MKGNGRDDINDYSCIIYAGEKNKNCADTVHIKAHSCQVIEVIAMMNLFCKHFYILLEN
jgi:hypothetical protein